MTSRINTEGNTADREIVISRIFDAPREMVWEAMANPEPKINAASQITSIASSYLTR